MKNAIEVAEYITKSLPVDNLKLQKLLYYSQAVHLVLNDKIPLFPDEIEAWDYGPVVPSVYQKYKKYGFETIPPVDKPSILELNELQAVDMTLACFGDRTGAELINQTHRESPWKSIYKPGRPSAVITIDSMYKFFKDNLEFTEDDFK